MSTDVAPSAYDLAVLPILRNPDKDDSWRDEAACLNYPREVFFNGRKVDRAKAICASCSVRASCLTFALNNYVRGEGGIFGGLTEDERKALL